MKLKTLTLLLATAIFASCNNDTKEPKKETETTIAKADNKLTEEQVKDGWQLLFDGTSMKGWHKYGNKPVGTAWKVADGAIYLDTTVKENWQIKDGGDIVSDSSFGNFHLKLEWKISKGGNSGIIFYVHEDTIKYDYVWKTGPEMQVLDDSAHSDGKLIKHRAGDLYDLISCTDEAKKPLKPVGEWNLAEIKSLNGKLDFYLNGKNVVSTTLWDDAWKKLVTGSKFKDFPGFGTYNNGHIALQDHGNLVWYKNVMIKKL
jgi:hypothetical protein